MSFPSRKCVRAVASSMERTRPILSATSKVVGLLCTLVALSVPFGCSPVPYTSSSESPYTRPVKPEDLYVESGDEQGPPRIEPGDSLEVIVRRGAGEERSLVTVRDNGQAYIGSLDVDLNNLTVPEAEARLTERMATIIRNPRVEVTIKQKKLQAQKLRVFLIGGGLGTGNPLTPTIQSRFAELDRKMSVGQLIAQLGYNDYAVLDDIRVIRGDARKPEVIPVDLQRLYQYGDRSRDIMLKNNDIVFIPRQRIGDWNAFLLKMQYTLYLLLGTQTMSPTELTDFLQRNHIQPIEVPTITVR